MKKICIIVLLVLIRFFCYTKWCNAFESFVENFTNKDTVNWNYTENGGYYTFNNGYLSMGSTGQYFPVANLRSSLELFSTDTDSVLEIKFKFDQITASGSGFGIGFTGNNGKPFYEFGIWADNYYQTHFLYNDYFNPSYGNCTRFENQESNFGVHIIQISNDKNWHVLRIEKKGTKWQDERYYVYLDKDINSVPIFTTDLYPCNPRNLWLGNPLSGGAIWTQFSLDYLKIFDSDLATDRNKIILIPGLGASWNTRAMVYNDTVPDNGWTMTPFVNNYNGIVKAFENNGLVKDTDFFVWNYDWRRPIGNIEESLDSFIDSKVVESEKVDLVGHSLGGIVARVWGQDHFDDNRLGKVISVGSPQQGSVEAYDAWNGAKIGDNHSLSGVALNLMLLLQKKNKQSKVETIHSYAPVVRDLIPIYDFTKKNGKIKSSSDLVSPNNYLVTRNLGAESLFNKYLAVMGTGEKTKEWINLGETPMISRLVGEWPDGKPTGYEYTDEGDGTVLKKSILAGDGFTEIVSNHGDMVNKGLAKILEELGLESEQDFEIEDANLKGRLLFFIGSPAGIGVSCDGGPQLEDNGSGFVVIDASGKEKCSVLVSGKGSGTYHLVTGKIGEGNSWRYWEDEINENETRLILMDAKSGLPMDFLNDDYWYGLLTREIKLLLTKFPSKNNLKRALDAVVKKDVEKMMDLIFNFRVTSKEVVVTNRILDISREIMVGKYRNVGSVLTKVTWEGVLREKEIVYKAAVVFGQKRKTIDAYTTANYEKVEDLTSDGLKNLANRNYGAVWADVLLISRLLKIFWLF